MRATRQTALARLLQERREALGYTRPELARRLGISAGTIEGWELGRVSRPPLHDVLRLARFLEIPMEEIERAVFKDVGKPPERAGGARPLEREAQVENRNVGTIIALEAAFRLFAWSSKKPPPKLALLLATE